jgi:peptide/nickel transport system permease protein
MDAASPLPVELKALQSRWGHLRLWLALQWRQGRHTWRLFARNRLAVFGVILILIYALMSLAHPILMATVWHKGVYDPQVGYDMEIFAHPSPPGPRHLLGTDTLGRDVLSRLLAATTPTFILALTAALTTAAISTLIAAFSAYAGGILATLQTHLADIFLLAPAPLIMVVIGGTIDIKPVTFGLMYGSLAGLGGAAIVMRSQALSILHKPYIEAAHVAGASGVQIISRHLIPNMLPLAAVQMLISVTGAVFADGFSTFLGLSRTRLNWGSMIYDSFTYQAVNAAITWNVLIPSALSISLFAAAFYMIARGVHEVAEPRLRGRETLPASPKALTWQRTRDEQGIPPQTVPAPGTQAAKEAPPPGLLQPRPAILIDDETAFAWLEYLARRQGASQGLLLEPEQWLPDPPEWVTEAGALTPTPSATVLEQARRYMEQGDRGRALSVYAGLIRSGQRLTEVIQDLSQACDRYPGDITTLQALGDAHLRAGNPQKALESFKKAEELINADRTGKLKRPGSSPGTAKEE